MRVWAKSRTSGEDAQSFACGICAVAVAPLHIPLPLAGAALATRKAEADASFFVCKNFA